MKRIFIFLLVFAFIPIQAFSAENWTNIGNQVNNAFFFVVDKIIALQDYFLRQALFIGRIVFLIAISSAALNYALTGTGLKENIIKILKATVFFFIVIVAYPNIIGGITKLTFDMANGSIIPSVSSYFTGITNTETFDYRYLEQSNGQRTVVQRTVTEILKQDNSHLFGNLITRRTNPRMSYTTVSPAAVFKIIFFLASDCFAYADNKTKWSLVPEFSRILKGLICAFVIIFTGIFALLEYLVCFLEFMLVATVGVILFPFSLWDGTKFLAEKFIGAIVGFFIKLLFCTIAIFLLIYGFVSLFNYFAAEGFTGSVDQIIFILFVCLLFLFICKSAPGVAQSLLTGTPSLNAAGAISAVGGAVAAAGAVGGFAQKAARIPYGIGGNVAGASQAAAAVKNMGGDGGQQAAAFLSSLGKSTASSVQSSLARNLLGLGKGRDPLTWQDRMDRGSQHAKNYASTRPVGSIAIRTPAGTQQRTAPATPPPPPPPPPPPSASPPSTP